LSVNYIGVFLPDFFLIKAKDMVENILSEFKSILKESDWMDEVSKQKAIEKATLIDIKIGYSERIYNNTKLNEQYKVNFSSTEFLENHYTSIELGVMNSFKELRKEIDPKQSVYSTLKMF